MRRNLRQAQLRISLGQPSLPLVPGLRLLGLFQVGEQRPVDDHGLGLTLPLRAGLQPLVDPVVQIQ
jgi:hypothetical protein